MRLIDADALLEKLRKTDRYFMVKFDIESEPTVELQMGRMTNGIVIPIERLSGEWIPVTTCDMTEEDAKELLDDADLDDFYDQPASYWQYNCRLPDDGQEVLVSTKWGIKLTTFYSDVDYGNYFEEYEDRYDVDAWMPLPEPYEKGAEE